MRPAKIMVHNDVFYVIGYHDFYTWDFKRHRNGAPAIIRDDGSCEWWVKDIYYDDVRAYCKALKYTKIKTMQMVLKYGNDLPLRVDQL